MSFETGAAQNALLGIGIGTTAISAFQQFQGDEALSSLRASSLRSAAKLQQIRADEAVRRGNELASARGVQGAQNIGNQRALAAVGGVQVDTGSVAEAQVQEETFTRLDQDTIKNNAWREAFGYKATARDLRFQAKFEEIAGRQRRTNTILTAGAKIASDAIRFRSSSSSTDGATGSEGTTKKGLEKVTSTQGAPRRRVGREQARIERGILL